MKRKRNIYDADDAAKSKRLHFSAEERAAHAEKKAEILGEKLEKAKADLPKKRRARINREFDAMTGKVRHSLSFEDEVKPRSRKNPVARAGLKAGRTVDLAAHSKIRQVEKENVGTEAAHKTEFAAENLAAGAIRKGYRSVKDAPYRKVERLEVKSAKATVNANYHAAVRDNPELQKHSLSALFQKRKLKREYAKAYREARKTGSRSLGPGPRSEGERQCWCLMSPKALENSMTGRGTRTRPRPRRYSSQGRWISSKAIPTGVKRTRATSATESSAAQFSLWLD